MIRNTCLIVAAALAQGTSAGKGMGMGMGMGKTTGRLTARVGPYPDSDSSVDGSVSIAIDEMGALLLQLNVDGLSGDMTNAGVHVHAGTSCATSADPLGHFWDTVEFGESSSNDPWNTFNSGAGTRYSSNADGVSDSAIANVYIGFGYTEIVGRTVVLHDDSGVRIGCGILTPEYDSLVSGDVQTYPGYVGSLTPSGTVEVEFYPDRTFSVSYDLEGVGSDCSTCGIHVHEGVSCADAGGHWWVASKVVDLWLGVFGAAYNSDGSGKAKGTYYLSNGFSAGAFVDRAVVVHAQDGARIGCATLSAMQQGKSGKISSGTSGAQFISESTAGKIAMISGGLMVVGVSLLVAKRTRKTKSTEARVEQEEYATLPLLA